MKDYNIKNYTKERWDGMKDYIARMIYNNECDPSYPCLNYICDRLELNLEQRYWLAYLYSLTYCAPSAYYIFNEFPDAENVNVQRMERWWRANKSKILFQSDRAKVKNFDKFVPSYVSYHELVGDSQVEFFRKFKSTKNLEQRYNEVYRETSKIYYFGRFTLFNYLESLNEITDLELRPTGLNLREAESCRNGLCYGCGLDDMITLHHKKPKTPINYDLLQDKLLQLKKELQEENPELNITFWNIETALCSLKKLFWSTRYFPYYIDRQLEELNTMESNIKDGVEWSLLWDFRSEFFDPWFLGELNGWKGIRKERMNIFKDTGRLVGFFEEEPPIPKQYSRKVSFPSIGNVYESNMLVV
ncbi:hypothetical protein KAW18_02480 [candidate division WOR-3 bacterium]|nr:hypothetical protein [candidate division WOR-3 bacterium]